MKYFLDYINFNGYRSDTAARRVCGVLIAVDRYINWPARSPRRSILFGFAYNAIAGISYSVSVIPPPLPDVHAFFYEHLQGEISTLWTWNPTYTTFFILATWIYRALTGALLYHVVLQNLDCPEILDVFLGFDLSRLISAPTRVSCSCSNILDLEFTSHSDLGTSPLTCFQDVSEHQAGNKDINIEMQNLFPH